jgi:nitrite reductase (NO-forming)
MSAEQPDGTSEVHGRAPGPQGAARRVAIVQAQARATLRLGGGFAIAAALALVVPHRTGAWLPLHLFLAGSLLLAISASTQLFAVTWAAGPAPRDRVATTQRWLLAAGVALLATARELRWPSPLVGLGGSGILAALLVHAGSLWAIVTRAVQPRFDVALRTYLAAIAAGLVGGGLGIAMAVTESGAVSARMRATHVALNLLGLIGLVIIGSLPFFAATQLRVKIAVRASAGAQSGLLVWQASAVTATAIGLLAPFPALAAVGFGAYAIGLVRLATLLPGLGVKQLRWAGPRVLQLAAGLGWWILVTAFAAVEAAHGRAGFTETSLRVLVVGGYAQILTGSLAYLAPVLRGGGHEQLAAGFRVTRSWIGLVCANVASVAIVLAASRLAVAAIMLWVLDAMVRAARLRGRSIGFRV